MEGFTESERKGLLGKIINYFDSGSSPIPSASPWGYNSMETWGYNSMEKKQILLEYFTIEELKEIYYKIVECENKTFFQRVNPFFTQDKIKKVYNYLSDWKMAYWRGGDMSGFLCGLLGRIRSRTKVEQITAFDKITDKTNEDISKRISEYLGGKKTRKNSKSNKTRKSRKTSKSRKSRK